MQFVLCFSHPSSEMDGPSAERLHRHIKVFEDKIITAQHTFSPRTFHEMMKMLKLINHSTGRIVSLMMLKQIIENEYNNARHIEENTENSKERQARVRERRVRVYFKWFLDFVDYLRAMKNNFDTKIHKSLLQLFYDKLKDSPYGQPTAADEEASGNSHAFSMTLTDFSTLSGSSIQTDQFIQKMIRSIQTEYRDIAYIYENKDLDEMAERLLKLSRKLENLLREDNDLDVTLSKIPKPHDGKKDIGDDVFNFIHLMNSIFVKFKSICDFSKTWLETDSRRMQILQDKLRRLKEIQKAISRKKIDLGFAIKKHQLDLERQSNGLNVLLKREERINDLNAMKFDTEQTIVSLKADLQKSREDRDLIAQELLGVPSTSKERFEELKSKYHKNRVSRYILFKTIEAQEYQLNLIEEDIMVETELKPSIILSTNDAQEKYERLETLVEEESTQKQVLENILGPLQKDRQMIESELLRQIMLEGERRNSSKNFVWGPKSPNKGGGDRQLTSRLSLPEASFAEQERHGSGRLRLLDPKYSISEVEEELTLRRNYTTTDFRSRYEVLRNIESDPGLSRHTSDCGGLSWASGGTEPDPHRPTTSHDSSTLGRRTSDFSDTASTITEKVDWY